MTSASTANLQNFSFFALAWALERSTSSASSDANCGGEVAASNAMRYRANMSLGFPVREIEGVEHGEGTASGPRWSVTTNVLGLLGSTSPLPPHLTERLLHGSFAQTSAVRDFLDVFNHRALELLYEAWRKYRYHATFRGDDEDPITRRMHWLAGLVEGEAGGEGANLLRVGGLLTQRPRSAAALQAIVADFTAPVPVRVEQLIARRIRLPQSARGVLRCRCDSHAATRLGNGAVVGRSMLDRMSTLRFILGPLSREQLENLLPGTLEHRKVVALIRRVLPMHLVAQLEMRHFSESSHPLRLERSRPPRLGWTAWFPTRRPRMRCVRLRRVQSSVLISDPQSRRSSNDGCADSVY